LHVAPRTRIELRVLRRADMTNHIFEPTDYRLVAMSPERFPEDDDDVTEANDEDEDFDDDDEEDEEDDEEEDRESE
jgi:hypothetical protein